MKGKFQTTKYTLITAAVTLALLSLACLAAVTKKGDFRGKFAIQFFKKGPGGQWELADKWASHLSA
jgi:hypothetical protein